VEKYADAIREVIANWPSYLANYSVGWPTWIGFITVFAVVAVVLALLRRRPKASLIDVQGLHPIVRERFEAAVKRFGTPIRFLVLDGTENTTYRFGNDLYLSRAIFDQLHIGSNSNAADQLYFVLRHESVHHGPSTTRLLRSAVQFSSWRRLSSLCFPLILCPVRPRLLFRPR
jgi:hypothetical protein